MDEIQIRFVVISQQALNALRVSYCYEFSGTW